MTRHHPEAFLIKFEHSSHCYEAMRKGFVKRNGIELHFIKWRSLSAALGIALMFRVRLCLDGIPRHAWSADIVERLIARTCGLEEIETNLIHPVDTRTVDVWAWTGNPSSIPKRMWLTFTGSTRGAKPEQILVSDRPPAHWQHGAKFCVYIHLEEIHDYTTVAVDLDGNEACAPSKRRLPEWHLGVADGDPVPTRAFENFPHHPPPPRTRQGREPERIDDRDDRRRRAKDDRDRSRPRRSYNDDHPDHDRDQAWRRRDDDDDRDGRGGRGREAWRGRESRKVSGLDGQRVRERSPRRRDWAEDDRRGDRRHHVQAAVALPATIPPLKLAPKQVTDFKMLFSLNSHPLQAPRENLRETGERLVNRVNNFAAAVDDASQPGGEEAWSDRRPSRVHDVPIRQVFDRLKHCLFPAGIHSTPSHSGQVMPHDERASIGAVEEALAAL